MTTPLPPARAATQNAALRDAQIEALRAFNRFYTKRIGALDEALLGAPFTLTEARTLLEIAHRDRPSASAIATALALDPGYLSRLLSGFERRELIARQPDEDDARKQTIALTDLGRTTVADLEQRSRAQVGALLDGLSAPARMKLINAVAAIEATLPEPNAAAPDVRLRAHRPGDLGWVISRHAALYAEEYGWDGSFEAMVADVALDFLRRHDPARERCFIAERIPRGMAPAGVAERIGSATIVAEDARTAKLRLVFVEPQARGLGVGRRLVRACLDFAREAGYARATLWTNDVLTAARTLYEREGFALVSEEPHHSFGVDLIGQVFDRDL